MSPFSEMWGPSSWVCTLLFSRKVNVVAGQWVVLASELTLVADVLA